MRKKQFESLADTETLRAKVSLGVPFGDLPGLGLSGFDEKLKLKLDLPDGSALARYAAVWEHEQSESSPHAGDASPPE